MAPVTAVMTAAGRALDEHRRALMLANGEGVTPTFIRVHGADRSPELHLAVDPAVVEACGWGDVALEHGYHGTTQGVRFTVGEGVQVEVLDRLLALNHERWAGEVAAGLHVKGRGKGKVGRRVDNGGQGALFGEGE